MYFYKIGIIVVLETFIAVISTNYDDNNVEVLPLRKSQDLPCVSKDFGHGSQVCVCNETYCDTSNPELPYEGQYLVVKSSKGGHRFTTSYGDIKENLGSDDILDCIDILNNGSVYLTLDRTKTDQTIIGFGGSFTDATGYHLNEATDALTEKILNAYYAEDGLKYNMGRVPIGHTDFSTETYYNNDTPYDYNMTNWKLTMSDNKYKIPFMQKAKTIARDEIYFICGVWSMPKWMRTKDLSHLLSVVNEDYYYSFALYLVKFLEAYKNNGLNMWGLSFTNEPFLNSQGTLFDDESDDFYNVWTVQAMVKFITLHLKKALQKDFATTKIIFLDELRAGVRSFLRIAITTNANEYLEVLGLHSYGNDDTSPRSLEMFHKLYPNVTIITTEFCNQIFTDNPDAEIPLGTWDYAESFAKNIIEEMNHHYSAWIHWNMVLNRSSRPRLIGVPTAVPIIIDNDLNVFYKDTSYYAMGHFSKYIPRGSIKIEMSSRFFTPLKFTALFRPDGYVTAVLFNPTNIPMKTSIREGSKQILVEVEPRSIYTVIF